MLSFSVRGRLGHLQFWSREEEEAWDLKEHVGAVVANVEVVELVAVEAEVLFQPTNIGVADVGLVFSMSVRLSQTGTLPFNVMRHTEVFDKD